jgi:hypothetical protein
MCMDRLTQLAGILGSEGLLGDGGARMVAIGSGWAGAARGVLSDLEAVHPEAAASTTMIADPKRAAYLFFKAHRGVRRTFTWVLPANAAGAKDFPRQCLCKRRLPMVNAGDPWQQGGVFVYGAATSAGGTPRQLYALLEESPGWPQVDAKAVVAAIRAEVKAGRVAAQATKEGGGAAASAAAAAAAAPEGHTAVREAAAVTLREPQGAT